MVMFGLLMFLASASNGVSGRDVPASDGFEDCVFQSTVDPKTEMHWHLPSDPGVPIGLWQGVLVQGGQIKAKLTASRSQGYGSSFWNHADSTARSEYLIPFIGSQPATAWRLLPMWMAFLLWVGVRLLLRRRTLQSCIDSSR